MNEPRWCRGNLTEEKQPHEEEDRSARARACARAVAGRGGGGGGWTDAQREAYIQEQLEDGESQETAECYADFFEARWPDYEKMENEFKAMGLDEAFAEAAPVAFAAQAKCEPDAPLFEE